MMKRLEQLHRGITPLLLSIAVLAALSFFFNTGMQWELKVIIRLLKP